VRADRRVRLLEGKCSEVASKPSVSPTCCVSIPRTSSSSALDAEAGGAAEALDYLSHDQGKLGARCAAARAARSRAPETGC
jgi:hypothetical protein